MHFVIFILSLFITPASSRENILSHYILQNKEKPILIGNSISKNKKIIKTIIANGYGITIDDAAQNAAENALTQVVGSFIDSETVIKKQKEIRDGIINRTKMIKKDIRDYSQGSIKYFEILNIKQNGSIYNITAKVGVRVEDLKAYSKKLASVTVKNSSTTLFAEMKTNIKNNQNKLAIYNKIVDPIFDREVYNFTIGNPVSLRNFLLSNNCNNIHTNYCKGWLSNFNVNKSIVIPFQIKLKEDFLTNIENTLINISNKSNSIRTIDWTRGQENLKVRNNFNYRKDKIISIVKRNNTNSLITFYILKDIDNNMKDKYLESSKKPLSIKLKDKNELTIAYAKIESCPMEFRRFCTSGNLKNQELIEEYYPGESTGSKSFWNYTPIQGLIAPENRYSTSSSSFIFNKRNYLMVLEFNEIDNLAKIKEIKIDYSP